MDLWSACGKQALLTGVEGELVRLVESQEQVATSSLVDDLHAQALLEDLLEPTKPPLRAGTAGLHYLLAAPFRYPPLRHGSRFGSRHEPALFYGSRTLGTALAEVAYYRSVFLHGMRLPPPSGRLLTQHTAFTATYRTPAGARLQAAPCAGHRDRLAHPGDYTATQTLGSALRGAGCGAIEYVSARDRRQGLNVALLSPLALADNQPRHQQAWLCETRANMVRFSHSRGGDVHDFPLDQFLVDGRLPQPAV